MVTLDARGLSCPQPVLMAKEAASQKLSAFEVMVDNETARENVHRFMEHSGYQVQVEEKADGEYTLSAKK